MVKTPKELMAIIAPEFTSPKYDVDGAIIVAKIRVDSSLFYKQNISKKCHDWFSSNCFW